MKTVLLIAGLATCAGACGSGERMAISVVPPDAGSVPADAGSAADPALAIMRENQRPGSADWTITKPAWSHEIEGYADVVSAAAGSDVHIAVSTTPPALFTAQVFRIGWYAGTGGRLARGFGPLTGSTQAEPSFDPVSGLVAAHWTPSFTVITREDNGAPWPTGVYLVLLETDAGAQSYSIFILRDDTREADVVVELPTATWQAYNQWGGESLYATTHGLTGGKARKVSYDRPYQPELGYGGGLFTFEELPLIQWLEQRGYDVEYATNLDVGGASNRLGSHRALVAVGHDEYATLEAQTRLMAARAAGMSLLFLTGDTMYWQVRYEAGDRVEVCYKDMISEDPLLGVDDVHVTTRFRDPPVLRPENALLGLMSTGEAEAHVDWIVVHSDHWIYAGTGLHDGDTLPGLVGIEWDTFFDDGNQPPGVMLLAASPVPGLAPQNASIVENGGTFTFDAGTIDFVRHLDDARVGQILENLLAHAGTRAAVTVLPGAAAVRSGRGLAGWPL